MFRAKSFLILAAFFAALTFNAEAAKNPFHEDTPTGTQSGIVTMKVTIDAPADSSDVKAWIPYPVSDEYQKIEDVKIEGNFDYRAVLGQSEPGSLALYAEWSRPMNGQRYITFIFKATAKERKMGDFTGKKRREPAVPEYVKLYTESTEFIPTGGEIGKLARKITKGKRTVAAKHKAVYNWIVEKTVRDPDVKGCGLGIVEITLASRSGKCVDLSSVYVALARAAGIPAREVFGLRLGKKDGTSDITEGHHCWAEYYQPGYGWVQTDPADVRKLMLVRKLDLAQAKDISGYYLNQVDQYRIALGRGARNFHLNPRQNDGPLNYFMYPYAEVNGKSLEWLAAQKDLKYTITFTTVP